MPLCFVIGPIGKDATAERKHSDLLLHAVIKEVLTKDEFDYTVKRADEDADPGMIGDRVVSDIINAELVVADLTDLNPNAFYELGIRHSTEKPTIHIARSGTPLPFDNVSHRTIFVDLMDWQSIEQARKRLAESVRATRAADYKVSNPITQANASFRMRMSEDPRDKLLAQMQEKIDAIEVLVRPKIDTTPVINALAEALSINRDPNKVSIGRLVEALQKGGRAEAVANYKDLFPSARLIDASDFVEAIIAGDLRAAELAHSATVGDIQSTKAFVTTIHRRMIL